jgi:predicted DsbA family dithiol-disulfide isomerase
LRQEFPIEVEAKAFLLRPDVPPGGAPRRTRPGDDATGSLSEPLATYAQEAGLVMRRPPLTSYTIPALEASEFAKEHGAFDAFHQGTYRAYWELGQDIGRVEVLQGIAREAGLDPGALAAALAEGRHRPTVQRDMDEALRLGVNAIPAFLMGGFFFSGARPYEFFRSLAQRLQEE